MIHNLPYEPVKINQKITNCDNNYLYCEPSFTIDWFNVNYLVYPTAIEKLIHRYRGNRDRSNLYKPLQPKTILSNLNGSFKSGRLSAIMGPSGAGKSTLIECLAGIRQKGLKGDILCKGKSKVTKAFIPQEDQLHYGLTVKESLNYSYGLKCCPKVNNKPSMDSTVVESLLHQLHLVDCSDLMTSCISGGQKKRTLIAQELVSKPDILFMDEPTSGLDSMSCQLLIKLLQKLAVQASMSIIITIHQPSAKVFNFLDNVYMLSSTGRVIFHGLPQQVVPALNSMGINCDPFNNPADLLIEVAFGEYGLEVNDKMADLVDSTYNSYSDSDSYPDNQSDTNSPLINHRKREFISTSPYSSCKPLTDCYINREALFLMQFKILLSRQLTISSRNPYSSTVRLFFSCLLVALLGGIYSGKGIYDGCVPNIKNCSLHQLSSIRSSIESYASNTKDNAISFYFLCSFVTLTNILPMVTLIPQDMKLLRKEYFNGWYRVSAYFLARNLADVPFILLSNLICVTGLFIFTSQPFTRYFQCLFIFTILSLIASTQGLITGVIFMHDTLSSVFAGPSIQLTLLLFSGFFSPIDKMPQLFRFLSWFSYLRHGFVAYTIAVFSDRCNAERFVTFNHLKTELTNFLDMIFKLATTTLQQWSIHEESESITNETISLKNSIVDNLTHSWFQSENQSFIIDYYSLKRSSYNQAIIGLILSLLISQLVAFSFVKARINY